MGRVLWLVYDVDVTHEPRPILLATVYEGKRRIRERLLLMNLRLQVDVCREQTVYAPWTME